MGRLLADAAASSSGPVDAEEGRDGRQGRESGGDAGEKREEANRRTVMGGGRGEESEGTNSSSLSCAAMCSDVQRCAAMCSDVAAYANACRVYICLVWDPPDQCCTVSVTVILTSLFVATFLLLLHSPGGRTDRV